MTVSQPQPTQIEQTEMIAEQKRNRAAKILSSLFAIAAILSGVFNFAQPSAAEQDIFQLVVLIIFTLCGGIGFMLARAGKTVKSATVIIIPNLVLIPLFITQSQGLGLLLSIFSVTFSLGIASATLPTKYFRSVLIAAVFSGLFTVVGDLYWPFEREITPLAINNFGTYVAIGIMIVVFFFVLRNFSNYTLNTKIITLTIAVATLAILTVGFSIERSSRNALIERTGENLQSIAQAQALTVGELLFRELSTLQTLSLNQPLLAALEAQNESYTDSEDVSLSEILAKDSAWLEAETDDSLVTAVLQSQASVELRRFRNQFPENTNILVTDQYGALVASTNLTARYYHAEARWWESAYNVGFGATYFGQPEVNERNEDEFIQIALPLIATRSDGSRAFEGILQATYSLTALEDLMVAAQFGDTGHIRVHFPDFELILNEDGEMVIGEYNPMPESILSETQFSDEGYAFINVEGFPNIFSVQPVNTLNHQPIIDELQWLVSAQQTEAEALASIQNQQQVNVMLGTIVILVAAAGAAFFGSQLTNPIIRLTAVAEKVTAGDLDSQAIIQSKDEIGILANAFNSMTNQLRESITTLEERVQDRTRVLEASIEVGRSISSNLDPQKLVVEVVNQVRDAFNYYHAHIYLIDKTDPNTLHMAGGTGTAGQKMLANKHTLSLGMGLVGRAASAKTTVLAADVSREEGWLPNPLLPDTKAEMALPIIYGDDLLGILDVQHDVIDGLQQSDVDLLESIAAQVAIALQNARSYEQAQHRASQEARFNEINRNIQSTTDVETALQVAVRELGRVLDAKQVRVKLGSGENGRTHVGKN